MREHFARTLMVVFLASLCAPYFTVDAQLFPDVQLECSPLNVDLNTKEGADNTGITSCTVTNGSAASEEIEISVNVGDPIIFAAPAKVTVAAGESNDFQIIWSTNSGQNVAEHNFTITATVTSVNGIPWGFAGIEDSNEGMIYLTQFGSEDLFIEVGPNLFGSGTQFQISCDISNEGNGDDKIIVEITNGKELVEMGFVIESFTKSADLKPGEEATVTFSITTPETIATEGSSDLEFEAYSKFERDNDPTYTGTILKYGILLEADESDTFFDASSLDSSDAITGGIVLVSIVVGLIVLGVLIVIFRRRKLNKALDFDFD